MAFSFEREFSNEDIVEGLVHNGMNYAELIELICQVDDRVGDSQFTSMLIEALEKNNMDPDAKSVLDELDEAVVELARSAKEIIVNKILKLR
jgi:hypothetical protein